MTASRSYPVVTLGMKRTPLTEKKAASIVANRGAKRFVSKDKNETISALEQDNIGMSLTFPFSYL